MFNLKSYVSKFLNRGLRIKDGIYFFLLIVVLYFFSTFFTDKSFFNGENITNCDTCGVGITDLVRKVKKELAQLEDSMVNKKETAMFQLQNMEMEISFVVRQSVAGKVEGKYELVTVEGSKEKSDERVQKLILKWDAIQPKTKTIIDTINKPLDDEFIKSLKQKP